MTVCVTDDI